ncbi:hypothetical protein KFL_015330010, partial [Klebsormidium nitens]
LVLLLLAVVGGVRAHSAGPRSPPPAADLDIIEPGNPLRTLGG